MKNLLIPLIPISITWSFLYNNSTGLITFGFTPPDSVSTTLQFRTMHRVLLNCLGFSNSVPSGSFGYDGTVSTFLVSTQNVNIAQLTSLYIRSDSITQIQNFESLVVSNELSDILAKVQISNGPGSILQWNNSSDLNVKISNKTISNINLYLTSNLSYETLDMRGLDWSIRLTFQEIETYNYEIDKSLSHYKQENPDVTELEDHKQQLIDQLLQLKKKLLKFSSDV